MKSKFFIQGAQGVGKSTLLQEFVKNEKSDKCLLIDGIARNLKLEGVSYDKQTKLLDYYSYYNSYLNMYNKYIFNNNENYDKVFFIRSVLDVIVYTRLNSNCKSYPQIEKFGIELFNSIRHKVDKIIYLPIEIPLIRDGIRNNSSLFQRKFDNELLLLFDEQNIEYITLNGSLENRLQLLNELIV